MKYLDGFSGYGGFHLGFENAGWKFDKVYFSEIDKYAIANYSHNFPKSIYAGSINTICNSGIIDSLDLFTFGWPCQDNSIAGKRKGQQSGTRSGLLYEAVKIINQFKPRNFVAENVAGLLTVNKGIDIVESFKILSFLNESCPQYDIEMQLLNTRWVLPQNRERLFFVGHLRGSGSREIFPIGENDIKPFKRINGGLEVQPESSVANCLNARMAKMGRDDTYIKVKSATVSGFELAKEGDSINLEHLSSETRRGRVGKGVAQTLDTSCNQAVVALTEARTDEGKRIRRESQRNGTDFSPRRAKELVPRKDLVMNTVTATQSKEQLMLIGSDIRRLTPIECERLQGLPDDWTKFGFFDGEIKELSDTQRYRLCGNGVSVPVIELIANRLKAS